MAHQCGTSGRRVRSDGGSEAVGAMLRGELGAGGGSGSGSGVDEKMFSPGFRQM